MPDLADLFPGYASEWITTKSGRIFARVGGKGPPLLLLHGFSETHVMWHRVAPQLADRFTLIIADLPGYGWSDMPESDADHTPYTKRVMAQAMVEAMERLGHVHFALAGHDRGGRVSYRLPPHHPRPPVRPSGLRIPPPPSFLGGLEPPLSPKIYYTAVFPPPLPLPGKPYSRRGRVFPQAEDGEPDQDEDARRHRSARAATLSQPLSRSIADTRDVRGLSRRRLCRLRDRQGRFRGGQEDHDPDAGAVGRCGHSH